MKTRSVLYALLAMTAIGGTIAAPAFAQTPPASTRGSNATGNMQLEAAGAIAFLSPGGNISPRT